MKYVNKAFSGIVYVSLCGALALGFGFVISLLFGADIPVFNRVVACALVLIAFLIGYAEGGGKSGEKSEEIAE